MSSQPLRLAALALAAAAVLRAEPQPGDAYREYTYPFRFGVVHPEATHPGAAKMLPSAMRDRFLEIPTLAGVAKAEISIEYWGGHIGTTGQTFRINGSDWFAIPQPQGTPETPQCYYRTVLGRATVEIPVSLLKEGRNAIQFTAGPQVCNNFNWGFYWVYAFTVRLYSGALESGHNGRIVSPADGAEIADYPRLAAAASSETEHIAQVDFLAEYEDFNWEGNGVFRQWHYITERGEISRHAGTARKPPFAVQWDTRWAPDQDRPVRLMARVTTSSGSMYMTPAISVTLRRPGRSVKMYRASNVPKGFGVRVGRKAECNIAVPDPLANARAARLLLSTWSAAHGDEIGWNGARLVDRVGLVHNYSFDAIPIAPRAIKPDNVFHIFSNTKEHALEVNWPGPVLLVEYGPPPAAPAPWLEPEAKQRVPIEVNAAGYERIDKVVEAAVEIPAGAAVARVTEGRRDVPWQLDPGGTLVWLMPGRTEAHATRRFEVYFGAAPRTATRPLVEVKDDVPYEGQSSFEIATPPATYFYHKEGAGFAGMRDRGGAEWIGYRPGGRSAGEFRGIPNLGKFAHPGYTGETGSKSHIESAGPLRLRIHSVRHDGKYAARWDIYPGYARMRVLKNAEPYWFLYEGTPAGKLDLATAYQVHANGLRRPVTEAWSGDLPGPEWVYFGDETSPRVLYVVKHADDDAPDQFWQMEGNMTVFGFGREYRCCRQYLDGPAEFTVGFAESTTFEDVARAIDSAYRPVRVTAGPVESAPR
jgi:hypothetical protein